MKNKNQSRGLSVLGTLTSVAIFASLTACGDGAMGTDVPRGQDSAMDVRGDSGVRVDVGAADVPNFDVPSTDGDPMDVPALIEAGPDASCADNETICGGSCTNTALDRNNCGRCGNVCPVGQLCSMGTCGLRCGGAEIVCGMAGSMQCVDPTNDVDNCGGCDVHCRMDQLCNGACVCTMGRSNCNDPGGGASCVDTQTNAAHCGMCGVACPGAQQCQAGRCVLVCAAPTTVCGVGAAMACVNLSNDRNNCGACGTRCNVGSSCVAGACAIDCNPPSIVCNVNGMNTCLDVRSNNANCGACNNACPAAQSCVGGNCVCPGGTSFCAGQCVNLQADRNNCGVCGTVCAAAQSCVGGACVCPAGTSFCGGQCVNLQADRNNCGGCGAICPGVQMCVASRCQLTCPLPFTVCGAGAAMNCVNLQTDTNNCGVCGTVCAGGVPCNAGVCRAPAPANDNLGAATVIALGAGEATFMGSTVSATFDGPAGCAAAGTANVWFRFTLATRELVYADLAGSDYDTRMYLVDGGGALVAGSCNDDSGCNTGGFTSGLESRVALVLNAGTYYISVSGFVAGSAGNFTLHFQHLATNRVSNFILAPISGTSTVAGTLVGATVATSNCGGTGSGEDSRWFMACGGAATVGSMCMGDGGTFSRRIGVINYDPSLYLISGSTGGETICNDDGGGMGGVNCVGTGVGADAAQYGSRINPLMTARGIHMMVVDERIGGAGMTYSLRYVLPP